MIMPIVYYWESRTLQITQKESIMTINTKKVYVELVEFLEANKNKKVSTILEQVKEMTKQKVSAKTSLTNETGEVVAIYCYYHKQWEILADVPYGKKASSTTGFNTMCKVGVSNWTKQNNAIKKVGETVLSKLESGEIGAADIADTKAKLIAEAKEINTDNMPEGFESTEAVLASLEEHAK